jgi:hypothetical protein
VAEGLGVMVAEGLGVGLGVIFTDGLGMGVGMVITEELGLGVGRGLMIGVTGSELAGDNWVLMMARAAKLAA